MVAAATLDALGFQCAHVAPIQYLVDAVWQIVAVERVSVAAGGLSPSIFQVCPPDDTIHIRGRNIVHVATHDQVLRRSIQCLTQRRGIITPQGKRTAHSLDGRWLDIRRDADIGILTETQMVRLKPEVNKTQLFARRQLQVISASQICCRLAIVTMCRA